MLQKKYRFHSRGGVRYTYAHGKTIRTPKFSLIYNDNNRGFQRFAVVVSKKVEKTAVGRNRIRRRMYEAISAELDNYDLKRDHIFIVYTKEAMTMNFTDLRRYVHSLLEQSMV